MRFRSFCFVAVFSFLGSMSLMAQMTNYESYLHYRYSVTGEADAAKASKVVDSWSTESSVQGYNLKVGVTAYADGSHEISVPSRVDSTNSYIAINNCSYDKRNEELTCSYATYEANTIIDYKAEYFDVMFFVPYYHEVYEKKSQGSFNVKRPA
jgi:hypothetical protein